MPPKKSKNTTSTSPSKAKGAKKMALELDTDVMRVFGEGLLTPEIAQVINDVNDTCPEISRKTLAGQAVKMRGRMRKFLIDLGRKQDEHDTQEITMRGALAEIPKDKEFVIANTFKIKAKELQEQARAATVTYSKEYMKAKDVFKAKRKELKDHTVHTDSQMIAITGPVNVIYDNELIATEKSPKTVICCSIPGINFAYSPADKAKFTTVQWNKDKTKKRKVVDTGLAVLRMKEILGHSFQCFQHYGVKYPCLSAIGCGAFKGDFDNVPALWAEALYSLLSSHNYGFECVFDSLPTFGEDNYTVFCDTFEALQEKGKPLKASVVMVENKSMVNIADFLSRKGLVAGLLNPSDVEAVRLGYIGMYWDGGHIALEEIIAMQTTLLMQHKGINPDLYTDQNRVVGITVRT